MTQKKELLNTLDLKKGDLFFQKTGKYCIIFLKNLKTNSTIVKVYGKSFIHTSPLIRFTTKNVLNNFKKLSK